MVNEHDPFEMFSRSRPTQDALIVTQYADLGLGQAPSFDELQTPAIRLMTDKQVAAAMGLVLGRELDPHEVVGDPSLFDIFTLGRQDPHRAFIDLVMHREFQEEQ